MNPSVTPAQIDLEGVAWQPMATQRGVYKIENNLLTIAWSSAGTKSERPDNFKSPNNIQVWKHVQPLPKFETPEELIAFLTSVTDDADNPDFEKYLQLYTDDEATRFAGMLIASMGMMNRMMNRMMPCY